MNVQIEKAIQILKLIREGHTTISALIQKTGNMSSHYNLKQLQGLGLVERAVGESRRKPYKLTNKGEAFLKLMA